ncbi:MAG TPA: CBS domain-containing protein [Kofleriaceae bacterium]
MLLRARDLMQVDPLTVAFSTPFLQIQHLFVVAQISGVPVVDDRGRVLGVISSSDLLRVFDQAFDDEIDSPESSNAADLSEQLGSLTAIDIATPGAIWVSPDCSIWEVAQLIRTERIHRVLVGEGGHLVGILTAFDLLQAIPS